MLKIPKVFFSESSALRLFKIITFFRKFFKDSLLIVFQKFLMSTKGPPFSLFDISQQRMLKNPKGSFFLIFRHYETAIKISHFLFFFSKFLLKTPKNPPSIFEFLQQNGC